MRRDWPSVRARYKLPEWFILMVGTIEPRKNLSRLITAYGQLRRQTGLPHALVIAGKEGWLFQGIYEQVDARRPDRVRAVPRFCGRC